MHLIYGEIKMMSDLELVEDISKKLDDWDIDNKGDE